MNHQTVKVLRGALVRGAEMIRRHAKNKSKPSEDKRSSAKPAPTKGR